METEIPATPDAPAVDAAEQVRIESLVDTTLGLPTQPPTEEPAEPPAKVEEAPEPSAEPEEQPTPPTPPAPEEPEEPTKPEPQAPAQELSYTFKDADGKEFVLKPGDNIGEILAEFSPVNNGQIMQVLYEFSKLEAEANSQAKSEAEAQEKAAAAAAEEERKTQQLASWDSEIEALQQSGLLDSPKAKTGTPQWEKDPAVQKVDAVFAYMTTLNKNRAEKQLPPVTSFGTALSMMNAEEDKKAKEEAVAKENETAKIKAGLIGTGGSPSGNQQEPYVAGSARTIWDVPVTIN